MIDIADLLGLSYPEEKKTIHILFYLNVIWKNRSLPKISPLRQIK